MAIETWAGVECTVNRVHDCYHDQCRLSGHYQRPDDLARLAELGVHAVRYPVLWEVVERDAWRASEVRVAQIRALGLRPIIGLVHHGSGPRRTSLVDPSFADGLAEHAAQCVERWPWIMDWTPVNEPLTTARFSGLYGVWYPHGRDDRTFVRALLVQCRAIVLAMQRIRAVNPQARLVQTEDIGATSSTPPLAYQAALENTRRWISLDLLAGRVDARHPLADYLLDAGADPAELAWFVDHPCPPDILGLNHYVTSERWLDHRLDRYPPSSHGTNGRDRYADVEAVRAAPTVGRTELLREAWRRYGWPIAITEAHLYSTRDEQLRWLADAFAAADRLADERVDVRAVTAWGAFGLYDWDSLVTCCRGHYEADLFDVRGERPRPTALARLVAARARGDRFDHPVLRSPGWWRRRDRIRFAGAPTTHEPVPPDAPPLLIIGRGVVGRWLARHCRRRGLRAVVAARAEVDAADRDAVRRLIDSVRPWAVLNATGSTDVLAAERDRDACRRDNRDAAVAVAGASESAGLASVHFSSDVVFDGSKRSPYDERDAPSPLGWLGACKAAADAEVLERAPRALVVRTSALFAPPPAAHGVVPRLVTALTRGTAVAVDREPTRSPTFAPDLVDAVLDLLIDGEHGLWHVVNAGAVSWLDVGERIAALVGADRALLRPIDRPAFVPRFAALASVRGGAMRPWTAALADLTRRMRVEATPA